MNRPIAATIAAVLSVALLLTSIFDGTHWLAWTIAWVLLLIASLVLDPPRLSDIRYLMGRRP